MGENSMHPNIDSGKGNIHVNSQRVLVKFHVWFYNYYLETIEW